MFRVLAIILAALAGACRPEPTAENVGAIRIGMRRAPDSFNPYLSTTVEGELIAARIFPTLFRETPELKDGLPRLEPVLAARHSWSEDRRTLRLVLREGLTWSDGSPLTSEDVLYTLQIRAAPEVGWIASPESSPIESAKAPSATELEIRFRHRSPFNLIQLNEGVILPKHHFGRWPPGQWRDRDWSAELPSFGPYRIGEYVAGERLILSPIEPGPPELGFAFIRDRDALYQLLAAREIDYAFELPVERLEAIRNELDPVIFPDLSFSFIAWNAIDPGALADGPPATREALARLLREAPHPLFGDARVRRAMTLAINRDAHVRRFWQGLTKVPATPWRAGLPYWTEPLQPRSHDPEAAARLLDEAGWRRAGEWREKAGRPLRFTLICNAGNAFRERYLLAIQQDLAAIGVDMRIEPQEASRFMGNLLGRGFDAVFGTTRAGTRPDLAMLFHGDGALGGYNFASWTSADDALNRIRSAETTEAMQAALAEAERLFFDEQPLTLLYNGLRIGASSDPGLKPAANYLDPLYDVVYWRARTR